MSKTWIVGAQVLTPTGTWHEASVLIDGERFAAVGASENAPEGAEVIDGTGKWLIPGLIDAHVHLCFSMDSLRAEGDSARLIKGVRNARINLEAGITTVRDVGAMRKLNIELANAIAAGVVPGPRVLASGEFIAMTGGHVHYWAREADGVDEVRKATREQLKAGAHLIKLMASGGAADANEDPDTPQLTETEMAVAVEEARRAGVKVAAHAHGERSMSAALRAGVDTLEHATFLTPRVVELLLEKGAAVIPTFAVYKQIADAAHLPAAQRENGRSVFERKGPAFAAAVKAGVRFGVGTDAGSYYPPGALAREMELMAAAGLANRDVLMAATKVNAELLGMESLIGTIETGKLADAVLLEADPLADLGALRRIARVIKGGRSYSTGIE